MGPARRACWRLRTALDRLLHQFLTMTRQLRLECNNLGRRSVGYGPAVTRRDRNLENICVCTAAQDTKVFEKFDSETIHNNVHGTDIRLYGAQWQ